MRSKSKKSLKDQRKNMILIIAVLVLVVINIIILIIHFSKTTNNESNNTVANQEQTVTPSQKPIEEKTEQERIQGYARDFYINIDNKEYEKAYNVLNGDFKDKYFPTLASFIEYVDKYIGTGELTINFNNIERLGNEKTGNLYILWVNVKDVLGSIKKTSDSDEEQYTNVVILEKGFDDYELSFSVEK